MVYVGELACRRVARRTMPGLHGDSAEHRLRHPAQRAPRRGYLRRGYARDGRLRVLHPDQRGDAASARHPDDCVQLRPRPHPDAQPAQGTRRRVVQKTVNPARLRDLLIRARQKGAGQPAKALPFT